MNRIARAPLLLLGVACLVLGLLGGLARLGVATFVSPPTAIEHHGVLMVGGFFGTLISLERAVALGARWSYLGPLGAGVGALVMLAGWRGAGAGLLLAGALALCAVSTVIWRKQRELFNAVLAAGALCWAVGNALVLAGVPVTTAIPWWIGFFVVTIAGERLELNRLLPPKPHATSLLLSILAALAFAAVLVTARFEWAPALFGMTLAALALWLLQHDVARRTVRGQGLPRYIAVGLLSGYAWLLVAALLMARDGALSGAGPAYDAALHALFVGFVFSMVFAHAPIVLPALVGVRLRYVPALYVPLALLHASLMLRLAGDFAGLVAWRTAGNVGNTAALVLFALTLAAAVAGSLSTPPRQPAPSAPRAGAG